jgi:protein arginine N-methyltransferase 1
MQTCETGKSYRIRYNTRMSAIELQRKLIGDAVRNRAFHEALAAVIRPGMTVADIGAGTGFLSFLALKLGAKSATLYEAGDALKLAKQIAKDSGITGMRFVPAHSTQVPHPEKADVVVSEVLGNFAYEEHIIETMNDAKRFLNPGGVIIPRRVRMLASPVMDPRLFAEIDVWPHVGYGIEFRAAQDVTMQNMYVKTIRGSELLDDPSRAPAWDEIDLTMKNASVREGGCSWVMPFSGAVYGLALWWECELVPGVTLSTSPDAPATHWEQIFLPLLRPIPLHAGDTLAAVIRSDTRWQTGIRIRWEVDARAKTGELRDHQELDMKEGFLA